MIIDQEYLKECFDYDILTGICTWRNRPLEHFKNKAGYNGFNSKFPDVEVGCVMNGGYLFIGLNGNQLLHRMICLWMGKSITGKQIDHINGVKTDNRWVNLRVVDQTDNLKNKKLRESNKTGVSGVSFYENLKSKPFRVTYYENNNKRATEFFVSHLFEAACIRKSFENKNGYHANHGRKS